jgi:hypothetical protein
MSDDVPRAEAPAERPDWFLLDGSPYGGETFRDKDGKTFGRAWVPCRDCSGNGRKGGRTCQACMGDTETWDRVRLQTSAELSSKSRRRDATRARSQALSAARDADRAARWTAFAAAEAPLVARIRASGDAFATEVLDKAETFGGMTDRQREAVVAHLDKAAADLALHARSAPVGTPGDRIEVAVTCLRQWSFTGKSFGKGAREVFVSEMMDEAGNAYSVASQSFRMAEGERGTVAGTVKEHDAERHPWCRTILTRAVLRPPAAEPDADEPSPPAP